MSLPVLAVVTGISSGSFSINPPAASRFLRALGASGRSFVTAVTLFQLRFGFSLAVRLCPLSGQFASMHTPIASLRSRSETRRLSLIVFPPISVCLAHLSVAQKALSPRSNGLETGHEIF